VNSTALVIAISYAVVTVLGIAVFVVLARSTTAPEAVDEKALAHREKTWLLIVVVGLLVLLLATIFVTPYGKSAPPGAQVVNVDARQFAFVLDESTVRAGEAVEFRLIATDVNHGFGVYTEDDDFVFQAQVVPDATTTVVHTFEEPGTYKILCLEYCGLNHHGMVGQFEVVS
jgi:cytochrome c oxidase subunit 2